MESIEYPVFIEIPSKKIEAKAGKVTVTSPTYEMHLEDGRFVSVGFENADGSELSHIVYGYSIKDERIMQAIIKGGLKITLDEFQEKLNKNISRLELFFSSTIGEYKSNKKEDNLPF